MRRETSSLPREVVSGQIKLWEKTFSIFQESVSGWVGFRFQEFAERLSEVFWPRGDEQMCRSFHRLYWSSELLLFRLLVLMFALIVAVCLSFTTSVLNSSNGSLDAKVASFHTKISQQLSLRLTWILLQTLKKPSGWFLITFVWLFSMSDTLIYAWTPAELIKLSWISLVLTVWGVC